MQHDPSYGCAAKVGALRSDVARHAPIGAACPVNRRSAVVLVLFALLAVGSYLLLVGPLRTRPAEGGTDATAVTNIYRTGEPRAAAATHDSTAANQLGEPAARASPQERQALARAFHALVQAARARPPRAGSPPAVTAPTSPRVANAPPATLDAQYIRDAVREVRPLLAECYERTLEEQPELEGTMIVEFTIEGEPDVGGVVENTTIADTSTLSHPSLDECVRETMYTLQLPAPDGSGSVQVRYPFHFSSADENVTDGGPGAR